MSDEKPKPGLKLRLPRIDAEGGRGFPAEESPTLVTCPACGGNWQIVTETETGVKMSTCRAKGCIHGAMKPVDAVAWKSTHSGVRKR